MRKGFLFRLSCFLMAVLMGVVISRFEVFEVNIVYANPNEDFTHFRSTFGNYKIIVFFCIGIILCNLINRMKWMWLFSTGLLLAYPLVSSIERLECLYLKRTYTEEFGVDVISITYTPLAASLLLRICSVLIFILCTILFMSEKREQKRIAALIELKRQEEASEEKRKDEKWRKSLFDPDVLIDGFPSNKRDENS